MLMQGAIVGDEYEISRSLGSGGMAQVFRARSNKTGATVAIKLLHAEQVGKARGVSRFKREGRLLCKLRHPNLVQGYAVGEHDGRPYIVMEYVDGPSIGELIGKRGRLTPEEALKLLLESTLALNHLYLEGSVQAHRDIKPQNILVTKGGVAKLTDFGIAKAFDEREGLTLTSTMMGSPHYMSPEQWIAPKNTDIRSDLYSLGCVFYEMLIGEKAYPGESQKSIMDAHFGTGTPSLAGRGELVDACNRVLAKTLAFEPSERYQTPHELATEIAAFVGAEVAVVVPRHSRANTRLIFTMSVVAIAATGAVFYAANTSVGVQTETRAGRAAPRDTGTSALSPAETSTADSFSAPKSVAPITPGVGDGGDVGAASAGSVDIGGMSRRITGDER